MESASYLKGLAGFFETANCDISAGPEPRFCLTIIRWGSLLEELCSMMVIHSTDESLRPVFLISIPNEFYILV
jgi:hypothetical protein